MQRAPSRYSFENNKLTTSDLTSNQVVGSSNLSGRAIYKKGNRWIPLLTTEASASGQKCFLDRVCGRGSGALIF